jgi:hypothetical protein
LVVHKVTAGRDRDWTDIERILVHRLKQLNFDQVRLELLPILELKGDTNAIGRLEHLQSIVARRLYRSNPPH